MKKSLLLAVLFTFLLASCSENDSESIDSFDFKINKSFALKGFENYYGITLIDNNNNDTILLVTNDTTEGSYTIVSEDDDSESKGLAVCYYSTPSKEYKSIEGTLLLEKPEEDVLSGSFTTKLIAESDPTDIISINNFSFNNVTVLKVDSPNVVEEEEFLAEEEDLHEVINALYEDSLTKISQTVFLMDAFYTNQIYEFGSRPTSISYYNNHSVNPYDGKLANFWENLYQFNFRVNLALEGAEKLYKDKKAKLDTTKAELLGLRAYVYSTILHWFGNGPIVTKTIKSVSDLSEIGFNNSEEIRNQVVQDLKISIAGLSGVSMEDKKITEDFSRALLARVYFSNYNYEKVIEILDPVILNDNYTLSASTDPSLIEDKEVVYGISFDPSSYVPSTNSWFGRYYGDQSVLNIIRYPELLLMLAESYNQTNQTASAIKYLNLLKERAKETLVTSSSSRENLTDLIYQQWKKELNKEGTRLFAMKSFDKAIEELSIEEYKLLLPIPQGEIDSNSNAKQNPGY